MSLLFLPDSVGIVANQPKMLAYHCGMPLLLLPDRIFAT